MFAVEKRKAAAFAFPSYFVPPVTGGFSRHFGRRGGNLPPAVRINSGALRSLRFRADGIRPYGFSRRFGRRGGNLPPALRRELFTVEKRNAAARAERRAMQGRMRWKRTAFRPAAVSRRFTPHQSLRASFPPGGSHAACTVFPLFRHAAEQFPVFFIERSERALFDCEAHHGGQFVIEKQVVEDAQPHAEAFVGLEQMADIRP